MIKEVLYYFDSSPISSELITELLRRKQAGNHLGFTFPNGPTHTCFNPSQEVKLKEILESYIHRGLQFEIAEYYRGNLVGKHCGIPTFEQPFVQWCPIPIISRSSRTIFDKKEPWGLTTDNLIGIPSELRELIATTISGLVLCGADTTQIFDLYTIRDNSVTVPPDLDYTQQPLIIDGRYLASGLCDIWRCKNGAIVCTNRFASLLNSFWEGLPDVKFQPVDCKHLSPETSRLSTEPLVRRNGGEGTLLRDMRVVEAALNIKFPKHYGAFIGKHGTNLPNGWLSPRGGIDSVLMRALEQERRDAYPAMPPNLIPIFAYGNGDYACFQIRSENDLTLVDWLHESGTVKSSSLTMD